MAFLDNSGDIILDAVLTDTGRMRLAQGDGSFKITKFALGDDEINYEIYNSSHASGSAYYDLQILQTPVFEAFTNNTSNLTTKLMSISRTNILYMPILKLNRRAELESAQPGAAVAQTKASNTYFRNETGATTTSLPRHLVAVDQDTFDALTLDKNDKALSSNARGVIGGHKPGGTLGGGLVRVDQGLETTAIAPATGLDSDLYESSYIVELDYRLGRLRGPNLKADKAVNFIDDDNIASYYISDPAFIQQNTITDSSEDADKTDPQVFDGPRGSVLQFGLNASQELAQSTYLFQQIGTTEVLATNTLGFHSSDARFTTVYYIDTTVRVVGANTGYRLDIPVRYVKVTS